MKKPDELVVEIERSIFGKALLISVIAHIVLMGATSVDLFRDWGRYGVHSPSYINAQKSRERKDAEDLARKQAALDKAKKEAEEAAAKQAAAATNKTAQAGAATTNKTATSGKQTVAAEEAGKKTPPEVEPLPPKKEFQYGDDLSLD